MDRLLNRSPPLALPLVWGMLGGEQSVGAGSDGKPL